MPSVGDLRCEYLADPLGVDTLEPRFSWRLCDPQPVRGRRQTAYHIQVQRGVGGRREMLWDSGRVASDQSVNLVYAGKRLASTWDCRWRVRVWDEQGGATPWSQEARFVMGLLDADAWQGQWIRSDQAEEHQHVWFRKSCELSAVPATAWAYVCSVGYHELYVNGCRIGDAVLTPGVTNLARRALYLTYDIADALRPGRNVIALWTGPGWARADGSYGKGVWDQTPMCRCHVALAGGEAVVSDDTWRCAVSSSENLGLWKGGGQGTYGGERVDARRHIVHWNTVAFDDTAWPTAAPAEQSVALSSAMFEPDRKVQMLRPVKIEAWDGAWRVDFGVNFTGWFEATFRGGEAGDVVRIQTANRIDATVDYDQESQYVFDASGEGTFCHRFNWMAGRWVTLVGLRQAPAAEDIRGYIVTNDRHRHGRFECSDAMLSAIYEADLRTYIANTINGAVMDCPHRERYGYGEVALACTWGCGIPNYDSAAFYTKATRDWCDVQGEDGMVNTIAPQPYLGAGGTLWSSAPLTMAWECYRAYGDRRLLAHTYPTIKRWLDYLHAAVTEDGVLMPYANDSRFLGDWATPHGSEYGNTPAAQLFNNCVYAYDLMVMVQAAGELGHDEDAARYRQRLDALRPSVHEHFYDADKGVYVDGRQMSMLFPLYVRVTPQPLRQAVLDGFARELHAKGYLDTGSPGLPIMLKCVVEDMARPELLYTALNRAAYPGYGYFLARQESTWPEYWEVDGITSRIHTCYTSIGGYFTKGIGGIQDDPQSPGMQRFIIRPYCPKALRFARTTSGSLYGDIVHHWKREGDTLAMQITIPPNSAATVHLPAAQRHIREGGMPLADAAGIALREEREGETIVEAAAGHYLFTMTCLCEGDANEA